MLLTREPGGAPGAEFLRSVLLAGRHDWSAPAETLLHFAARAEHVARTIRPALDAGMVVVCDRFTDSTMAYQGYGQGADRRQIAALAGLLGIVPDVTFVLDVPEPVAAARMAARGLAPDRYDRLGAGFHARVAAGFRTIAAAEPARCRLLEASAPADEVFASLSASLSTSFSLSLRERAGVRGREASVQLPSGAPPLTQPSPEGEGFPDGA